jgi:single-stranded DNA-binding protein
VIRQSFAGKTYATASMRVAIDGEEAVLASLIAFSDTAVAALLALTKGDALAVSGRGKLTSWEKDGQQHHGLSVVADQVLTLYALDKRRKQTAEAQQA